MPDFLSQKSNINNEYLSAKNCLNILSSDEKQELVDNKTEVQFEAGEHIVKRGLLANNVLYLTDGLVKMEIVNDSKSSTVAILRPHSFIGIACCFALRKMDFTATALTTTKVSFIEMDIFEKFIKNNGEFAFGLIKHISGISSQLMHRLTSLSQKHIDGALSYILLDFMSIYSAKEFEIPLTRVELGDMLGYSKESVINTLSKFNKEGIIKVDDRKIRIIDSEKLELISKLG